MQRIKRSRGLDVKWQMASVIEQMRGNSGSFPGRDLFFTVLYGDRGRYIVTEVCIASETRSNSLRIHRCVECRVPVKEHPS